MVTDIDIEPALSIIEKENATGSSLITVLQDIQAQYGYLPKEVLTILAHRMNIPISRVLSAATFYTQFRFEPIGKYLIRICHGTACHIAGASKLTDVISRELGIESGDTTADMLFTLEKVACLGCCALAPVVMINDTTYGKLTPGRFIKIVEEYRKKG
jgi:NADH-quinone oxidoreductase subunit E